MPDYDETAMEQALRNLGYSEEHISLFRGNTTQEYRSRASLKDFVIDQVHKHGRILNKDFAAHPDAAGMSASNKTTALGRCRKAAEKDLGVTLVRMPGRKGWMIENNLDVLYEQLAATIGEGRDIAQWLNQHGQSKEDATQRLLAYGIHNVPGTTKYHEV